ncbi:MAG: gp16 family protein [Pseudomonadota bacterium]
MKSPRQRLLAQIHVARKDLRLDEDTYRHLLREHTGRESCAELGDGQLRLVLASLAAKGWTPRRSAAGRRKVSPASRHKPEYEKTRTDKIRALWIDMARAGHIADGSERALGRYCRRMVGKDSPDWLSPREAHRVIECLKKWQQRKENANG